VRYFGKAPQVHGVPDVDAKTMGRHRSLPAQHEGVAVKHIVTAAQGPIML
jgi:hypothetical protein